ncbi:MAG: glycosyltransferase family 2 protein [Bacteroidales bacterium]|jgi:glycosyltransferase involved in cell wall biosynthesis|nr:glycosyltransferase family 2 protein [Bacteroidales bacterium]HOL98057.1 glycosyltransferase family 2 protein [Bacteroidales bacterium]HOM37108.1 glycosyltransferase family 2 protein [Bacteroidales bacterium]HPD23643.1 glycosyltransferase family 2 protein [Bacteroidales bacterium]HRS99664.1 glycosyltransferase family 2 protein [Bacteroidales bacterium]
MIKFSIVLPCYNEAENLNDLVRDFSKLITDEVEIIFVNNGSSDNTAEMLTKLLEGKRNLKLIHIEKNIGYGHGIITGLKSAIGEWVGWTHADLQTEPADVFKAIEIIKTTDDKKMFIKGNRLGRKFSERIFSRGLEFLVRIILKIKMTEINAQPKIFNRSLLDKFLNPPEHWGLDLYAYYVALNNGFTVKEIDVYFPERKHGNSKWNTGFISKILFSLKFLKYCNYLRKQRNVNNKS